MSDSKNTKKKTSSKSPKKATNASQNVPQINDVMEGVFKNLQTNPDLLNNVLASMSKMGMMEQTAKNISNNSNNNSNNKPPSVYDEAPPKPTDKAKNSIVKDTSKEKQKHVIYTAFNDKLFEFMDMLTIKLPHNKVKNISNPI
jgi:hypothetical protein